MIALQHESEGAVEGKGRSFVGGERWEGRGERREVMFSDGVKIKGKGRKAQEVAWSRKEKQGEGERQSKVEGRKSKDKLGNGLQRVATGGGKEIEKGFARGVGVVRRLGMKRLSHVSASGEASMVDVSGKPVVWREAVARGEVRLARGTLRLVRASKVAKGNVLATARLAGIMAAKRTGELIPLCHPLGISHCEVRFEFPKSGDRIVIEASAKVAAQTGVEMEALTAVSVAGLTIYDMCKAVDKGMRITEVRLVRKTKGVATEAAKR